MESCRTPPNQESQDTRFDNISLCIVVCLFLLRWCGTLLSRQLAAFFYSRGLLSIFKRIFGKSYAAWALCHHATHLTENGQCSSAIQVYTQVLALENSSADYWAHRGAAYYDAGTLQEAEADLSHALTLDSQHHMALSYRGFIRCQRGEYRQATDDLLQVQCENPQDAIIALYRGVSREMLGEWSAAVDDYVLAHQLNISETTAVIYLARLQAACPVAEYRDGTKAVENAYRMCVRTGWKDWVPISVLAAGYAEKGEFGTAVRFGEQALALAPAEEKPERQRRLEQFRKRIPFRICPIDGAQVSTQPSNQTNDDDERDQPICQ
jgi:Flp pilus assembly protein TadD